MSKVLVVLVVFFVSICYSVGYQVRAIDYKGRVVLPEGEEYCKVQNGSREARLKYKHGEGNATVMDVMGSDYHLRRLMMEFENGEVRLSDVAFDAEEMANLPANFTDVRPGVVVTNTGGLSKGGLPELVFYMPESCIAKRDKVIIEIAEETGRLLRNWIWFRWDQLAKLYESRMNASAEDTKEAERILGEPPEKPMSYYDSIIGKRREEHERIIAEVTRKRVAYDSYFRQKSDLISELGSKRPLEKRWVPDFANTAEVVKPWEWSKEVMDRMEYITQDVACIMLGYLARVEQLDRVFSSEVALYTYLISKINERMIEYDIMNGVEEQGGKPRSLYDQNIPDSIFISKVSRMVDLMAWSLTFPPSVEAIRNVSGPPMGLVDDPVLKNFDMPKGWCGRENLDVEYLESYYDWMERMRR